MRQCCGSVCGCWPGVIRATVAGGCTRCYDGKAGHVTASGCSVCELVETLDVNRVRYEEIFSAPSRSGARAPVGNPRRELIPLVSCKVPAREAARSIPHEAEIVGREQETLPEPQCSVLADA